jgi:hypothetical protein
MQHHAVFNEPKRTGKLRRFAKRTAIHPHISPYLEEPRRSMLDKQQVESEYPKQQDLDYYHYSHNTVITSKKEITRQH